MSAYSRARRNAHLQAIGALILCWSAIALAFYGLYQFGRWVTR